MPRSIKENSKNPHKTNALLNLGLSLEQASHPKLTPYVAESLVLSRNPENSNKSDFKRSRLKDFRLIVDQLFKLNHNYQIDAVTFLNLGIKDVEDSRFTKEHLDAISHCIDNKIGGCISVGAIFEDLIDIPGDILNIDTITKVVGDKIPKEIVLDPHITDAALDVLTKVNPVQHPLSKIELFARLKEYKCSHSLNLNNYEAVEKVEGLIKDLNKPKPRNLLIRFFTKAQLAKEKKIIQEKIETALKTPGYTYNISTPQVDLPISSVALAGLSRCSPKRCREEPRIPRNEPFSKKPKINR